MLQGDATATETLKNLVLPGCSLVTVASIQRSYNSRQCIPLNWIGIGAFTVVDGSTVCERDLGNNFFLETRDLGTPRAKATMHHLCEMNPDVKGSFLDEVGRR